MLAFILYLNLVRVASNIDVIHEVGEGGGGRVDFPGFPG